jgi:hypothetical protein
MNRLVLNNSNTVRHVQLGLLLLLLLPPLATPPPQLGAATHPLPQPSPSTTIPYLTNPTRSRFCVPSRATKADKYQAMWMRMRARSPLLLQQQQQQQQLLLAASHGAMRAGECATATCPDPSPTNVTYHT